MSRPGSTLAPLSRDDCRRVLAALLRDELARRHGSAITGRLWRAQWTDETPLDDAETGLDSLSLIATCSRVASFFGLHRRGLDDHLLLARRLGEWVDLVHGARASIDTIEFETSGTTGKPKRVRHALSVLWQEASLSGLLPGGGRVLSTVPACHAFGFIFGVLAARHRGRPVVEVPAAGASAALARDRAFDTIIAAPAILQDRRLCDLLALGAQHQAPTLICSGSPLPDLPWEASGRKPVGRVIDIYGATETLGIARREGGGWFTLLAHRRWQCATGTTITDLSGSVLPVQDILIRSGDAFMLGPRHDGKIARAGLLVDMDGARRRVHEAGAAASIRCDLLCIDGGADLLLRVTPPGPLPPDDIDRRIRTVISALPPEARPTRIEID